MDELFTQEEMTHIPTYLESIEYALEIADDFIPKSHDQIEDVEILWLTPSQLKKVLKYAKTGIKSKKTQLDGENFEFKINVTERDSRGNVLGGAFGKLPEETQKWLNDKKNK